MSVQTHKEHDGYASNYNHNYPLTAVPRSPPAYRPTRHFLNMKHNRNIEGDIIRGCIEDGDVHFAEEDNRYKFHWTHPTTLQTFVLVVELFTEAFQNHHRKHDVVTVYRFQH